MEIGTDVIFTHCLVLVEAETDCFGLFWHGVSRWLRSEDLNSSVQVMIRLFKIVNEVHVSQRSSSLGSMVRLESVPVDISSGPIGRRSKRCDAHRSHLAIPNRRRVSVLSMVYNIIEGEMGWS